MLRPRISSQLIDSVRRDAELIFEHWGFTVLPGVELTHCPPASIAKLARQAKASGAKIVVVHGETLVEPVPPGTNRASVECPDVDILAHPGLLTEEEAQIAHGTGVLLEITSRRGHCLGNGRTVKLARTAGARMVINSDTHSPGDLHTEEFARIVGLGAGLTEEEVQIAMVYNPQQLLEKVGRGGAVNGPYPPSRASSLKGKELFGKLDVLYVITCPAIALHKL